MANDFLWPPQIASALIVLLLSGYPGTKHRRILSSAAPQRYDRSKKIRKQLQKDMAAARNTAKTKMVGYPCGAALFLLFDLRITSRLDSKSLLPLKP